MDFTGIIDVALKIDGKSEDVECCNTEICQEEANENQIRFKLPGNDVNNLQESNEIITKSYSRQHHEVSFASKYLKNKIKQIEESLTVKVGIIKKRSCFTVQGIPSKVRKASFEIQSLLNECLHAKETFEFPGIKHNIEKMKDSIARVENKCNCTIEVRNMHDAINEDTEIDLGLEENTSGANAEKVLYNRERSFDVKDSLPSKMSDPQFDQTSLKKEIQFGKIRVRIKRGTIANEKVDVIVNSTTNNLQLKGGAVSSSILLKAGQEFQTQLLKNYPKGIKSGEVAVSDGTNLPCSIVLHVVLEKWDDTKSKKCLEMLRKAVMKCLEESDDKHFVSIAFPALGTGTLGFPHRIVAREMLDVIKDFSKKTDTLNSVTFIVFQADNKAIKAFEEELERCQHVSNEIEKDSVKKSPSNFMKYFWTKRSIKDHSLDSVKENEQSLNIGQVTVTLVKGELSNQRVNAIINTTSTSLSLSIGGGVSASLLRAAGPELQQELRAKYSGGIKTGEMAISTGKKLQCDKVYHFALQNWDGQNASKSKQALRSAIVTCLYEADTSGYSSIAFPAIGTGHLNFPCDVVASEMFQTVSKFQAKSLKDVRFVVFPKNKRTAQVFEDEFQTWTAPNNNFGGGRTSMPNSDVSSPNFGGGSYTIGKVRITVKQGDITNENTDAIVNSSNEDLDLSKGAVSNAIAKAGSMLLNAELKKLKPKMKNEGIVISTAYGLKCKYIIHVAAIECSTVNYSHKWKAAIIKCFQEAEKFPISSISIPALGTGTLGIAVAEGANMIFKAILEYIKENPFSNLTEICIVIYQPDMLIEYHRAAKLATNDSTKSVAVVKDKKTALCKIGNSAKNYETSEDDDDSITLLIIAEPSSNLPEIKRKLNKRFVERQKTKCIENVRKNQIEDIKRIALRHFVRVEYKTEKEMLCISGFVENVSDATEEIQEIIHTARNEENLRKIAAIAKNPVKWYYEKNHKFIEFDEVTNIKIESSRANNERQLPLKFDQVSWILDFDNKLLINEDNRDEKYLVRRKELSNVESLQTPVMWKTMMVKQNLVVVDLKPTSKEYTELADTFTKSVSQGQRMRYIIVKIERIQNRSLRTQYNAKKEELESNNPKTNNENMLWHGTAENAVGSINKTGFNRSYCGKNATYYGDGVYFAVNASYSARDTYSPPDSKGVKRVYHCRVLTGTYMLGREGLKTSTSGSRTYDSAVNDTGSPTIYVIFNDTQAYPEHMLYFKEIKSTDKA